MKIRLCCGFWESILKICGEWRIENGELKMENLALILENWEKGLGE